MNHFIKYGDIHMVSDKEWLDEVRNAGYSESKYVYCCYRKIDGSNFQISIDSENRILFGKRNSFTGNNFYNCGYIMEKYDMVKKIEEIRNAIVNKNYHDNKLNSWIDCHPDFTFILFGEIFGGAYDNPNVEKNIFSEKIIGRISYSPDNEFMAFDALLVDENDISVRYMMNLDTLKDICSDYHINYQIEEFRGTMDNCIDFKIDEINDDTGKRFFGLPEIDNNIIEGIVIKPVESAYINKSRIIFKKKNPSFFERKTLFKNNGKGVSSDNELENYFLDILKEYMNENRVLSAVSKVGKEKFGDVIREANCDAINDFMYDYGDEVEEAKSTHSKYEFNFSNITKEFNRYSSPIVRKIYSSLNEI